MGDRKLIIFLIVGVIFTVGYIPESIAVNANLFVSAEDSRFDNYISGPQVIEVIVIDSDIQATEEVKGEPEVSVNGKVLRMVQGIDGNWYGYFASDNMALIADATTIKSGIGLDFGTICTTPDEIANVQTFANIEFDTVVTVALGATNCAGANSDPSLQNVLRKAVELNNNGIVDPGQIDINPDSWPLIQLYPLNPTGNVVVQYNKGGGVQTTTLTFDTVGKFVELDLDKSNYDKGDDVLITIVDPQLNIDPTDEDSWTFGTQPNSDTFSTSYQVFDKDGNQAGDKELNGVVNLHPFLSDLMFDDNGILIIDIDTTNVGASPLTLQDNNNSVLEIDSSNPLADSEIITNWTTKGFNDGTNLALSPGSVPLTFTESGPHSGVFEIFDNSNTSNLKLTNNAINGSNPFIDYNESPQIIFVGSPNMITSLKITPNPVSPSQVLFIEATETQGDNSIINVGYLYVNGELIERPIETTQSSNIYIDDLPITSSLYGEGFYVDCTIKELIFKYLSPTTPTTASVSIGVSGVDCIKVALELIDKLKLSLENSGLKNSQIKVLKKLIVSAEDTLNDDGNNNKDPCSKLNVVVKKLEVELKKKFPSSNAKSLLDETENIRNNIC